MNIIGNTIHHALGPQVTCPDFTADALVSANHICPPVESTLCCVYVRSVLQECFQQYLPRTIRTPFAHSQRFLWALSSVGKPEGGSDCFWLLNCFAALCRPVINCQKWFMATFCTSVAHGQLLLFYYWRNADVHHVKSKTKGHSMDTCVCLPLTFIEK